MRRLSFLLLILPACGAMPEEELVQHADGGTPRADGGGGGGVDASGPFVLCEERSIGIEGAIGGEVIAARWPGPGAIGTEKMTIYEFGERGLVYETTAAMATASGIPGRAALVMPLDGPHSGEVMCSGPGTMITDPDTSRERGLELHLVNIAKLGTCPGGQATSDRVTICYSNSFRGRSCTLNAASVESAMTGKIEGRVIDRDGLDYSGIGTEVSFSGLFDEQIYVQLRFGGPDGGLFVWNTAHGSSPLIYCVGHATVDYGERETATTLTLTDLTLLGRCQSAGPTLPGSLDICVR